MADATNASSEEEPTAGRGFLGETGRSVAAVFENRNLRRIQLAFVGSSIGDWASGTAIAVWAYGIGGAKAVGIWMAVRMALAALTAPVGASFADKMNRRVLMLVCDLVTAVLVAVAALVIYLDGPAWPVFVLGTLSALLATPFRVAQRSLLPSLAERPEELTAANGTASTIESLSFFVGPALGASLLAVASVPVVMAVNVATFIWSMVLVAGVRPPVDVAAPGADDAPVDAEPSDDQPAVKEPGFLSETMAGFAAIRAEPGLVLVTILVAVQTLIAGASGVFVVVLAVEILGTGPKGAGYLDSVMGVGAILGGIFAISRASRRRLAGDLSAGVLLWSAPLVLVTLWPHPVACFLAMAMLGLGNPLVDVNMDTITQRITPDAVLGRVFGALEACLIATAALGAVLMPFLFDWLGVRWAMAVIAVPVIAVTVLCVPQARALDLRLAAPPQVPLLRGVDIFAPLSPAAVEALAGKLSAVRALAGEVVLAEGGESDRFYVIESGRVEVTQADQVLRQEGPGEYFGEIGLLRDVPRTATITALEETVLQTLSREDFLGVVTGHQESRAAAESTVRRRLRA